MTCTNPQVLEIRERFENILCEMSDIYKNSDTEEKFVQIMNGQINKCPKCLKLAKCSILALCPKVGYKCSKFHKLTMCLSLLSD